ncbi:MAG TPA: CHASE3 domain-containing protein, partial [Bryobacteraceae bacterium]|nr:CHASE3 domain-containing protein [Bryobacteraceae bacterium]
MKVDSRKPNAIPVPAFHAAPFRLPGIPLVLSALATVLAVGFVSFQTQQQYQLAHQHLWRAHQTVLHNNRIITALANAETGQRGFLLTGEMRYLEAYRRGLRDLPAELQDLRNLLTSGSAQLDGLTTKEALIREKLAEMDQTIRVRETRGSESALAIVQTDRGKELMDRIRRLNSEIEMAAYLQLREASERLERYANRATMVTLGGSGLLFLMLAGAAVTINRGVAKREQLAGDVRREEERFRLLVEGVTDYAIYMIDPDGFVASWNLGAARLKGYTASEIIGQHLSRFYTDPDLQSGKPAQALEIAKAQGTFEEEGWRVRQDGSTFMASVLITAIRDLSGELRGFAKVTRDITEKKKAEEELRTLAHSLEQRVIERTAQLNEANSELQAFSYSVSHDLRAPLRSIQGFGKILLRDYETKLDATATGHLNRINAATVRMGQLIEDLLNLSRISRQELNRTCVDLSAVATAVLRELSDQHADSAVRWSVTPGMCADGDARLIRVLLENLLGNAWKFSSKVDRPCVEFSVHS